MLVCRPNTFYDMCGSKILILQSVLNSSIHISRT